MNAPDPIAPVPWAPELLKVLDPRGERQKEVGGAIVVRIAASGDQACVTVTDERIGIPAEALPQLFQRFYRASNADTLRISGMGVGLYVVKEIVQLHQGAIKVASIEGQGSTFTVCLPRLEQTTVPEQLIEAR